MAYTSSDVLRCSVRFADANGNDHVNVYHLVVAGDITEDDPTILAAIEAYYDSAYSQMATNLSNAIDPVDIKVDQVEYIGGEYTITHNLGVVPFSMTTPPSASNDVMPSGVAALVKFLTGFGKTYGRKFLGMFTEAAQANGILSSGFQSQLADYADIIMAGIDGVFAGGDMFPGVMSEFYKAFKSFTSYDVSDVVAYQRRRRLGTGS